MNILLTNDDGYKAKGINSIFKKLSEKHNVYIIAPDENRSGVSSHINMKEPLEIKRHSKNIFSCSGLPVDCVAIGITSPLLPLKFDAVISGINFGANMGTDIIYSGTCAAARQGVMYGIPSIAVSLESENWSLMAKNEMNFEPLSFFILQNLEKLLDLPKKLNKRVFVNVNAKSFDSYKGVKFTDELCIRNYDDSVEIKGEGDVLTSHFKMGENGNTTGGKNSDYSVISEGYVSVSLIYADPVCVTKDFQNGKIVDDIHFSL